MHMGRTAVAALILVALAGCTGESPEFQVRRSFEGCVKALEAGDGPKALEVLSPTFEGPEGMDRNAARLFLLALLKRERLGFTVLQNHIETREQEAAQELTVVVTRRSGGSVLPDETSRSSFLIRWERRKGEWRVKSLRQAQ